MFRFLLIALFVAVASAFMAPIGVSSKVTMSKVAMNDATRDSAASINGDAYEGVWGMPWKTAVFQAWDPESPRTYTNFNPFERNDEAAQCDENGCFPGQSRGYKVPTRPDASWAIMQAEAAEMDKLKEDPKFSVTGKPGNFNRKWQDKLGAPP